ncbi:hypothetical protein PAI11_33200 [Patulibacter medicamentivorans]|uniref:PspA-associated domain-containing protein n=1 Tax=Patulibacter medicamentivorans TaxID=1097667 RepID=H0E906_9ACTN|nr:hypothetical protein [Patulibacter medicamentivorans]EHN09859.1 hypothetical protein PAI11_33200 [Patulibacter medicamentivorans]
MIVRIFGDQQYRLDDDRHGPLNELDDAVVTAVERGDQAGYRERFDALLAFVRSNGTPLADDELIGSDVLLPPDDLTFDEAGREFNGEGLVPDPADA